MAQNGSESITIAITTARISILSYDFGRNFPRKAADPPLASTSPIFTVEGKLPVAAPLD